MESEKRIKVCRLLDKMEQNHGYSQKLGLSNVSTYHGASITEAETIIQRNGLRKMIN